MAPRLRLAAAISLSLSGTGCFTFVSFDDTGGAAQGGSTASSGGTAGTAGTGGSGAAPPNCAQLTSDADCGAPGQYCKDGASCVHGGAKDDCWSCGLVEARKYEFVETYYTQIYAGAEGVVAIGFDGGTAATYRPLKSDLSEGVGPSQFYTDEVNPALLTGPQFLHALFPAACTPQVGCIAIDNDIAAAGTNAACRLANTGNEEHISGLARSATDPTIFFLARDEPAVYSVDATCLSACVEGGECAAKQIATMNADDGVPQTLVYGGSALYWMSDARCLFGMPSDPETVSEVPCVFLGAYAQGIAASENGAFVALSDGQSSWIAHYQPGMQDAEQVTSPSYASVPPLGAPLAADATTLFATLQDAGKNTVVALDVKNGYRQRASLKLPEEVIAIDANHQEWVYVLTQKAGEPDRVRRWQKPSMAALP